MSCLLKILEWHLHLRIQSWKVYQHLRQMQFVLFKTLPVLMSRKRCCWLYKSCQSSVILSFLIGIILREKKLLTKWVLDTQLHYFAVFSSGAFQVLLLSWAQLTWAYWTCDMECKMLGMERGRCANNHCFYPGVQILPWCHWKQQIRMVLGLSRRRRQLHVPPCPPSRLCVKERQKEGRKARWNLIRRSNRKRGKVVRYLLVVVVSITLKRDIKNLLIYNYY